MLSLEQMQEAVAGYTGWDVRWLVLQAQVRSAQARGIDPQRHVCAARRLWGPLVQQYEALSGKRVAPVGGPQLEDVVLNAETATWFGRRLLPPFEAFAKQVWQGLYDVAKVEEAWRLSGEHRAHDKPKMAPKIEYIRQKILRGQTLRMPLIVAVSIPTQAADRKAPVALRFEDGTHRYMVLRDAGATQICLGTLDEASFAAAAGLRAEAERTAEDRI